MINLFKCEKCGRIFEDYDEATECENKHMQIDWYETSNDETNHNMKYKEGEELPQEITVTTQTRMTWIRGEDGNDGKWKYETIKAIYKLFKVVDRQTRTD